MRLVRTALQQEGQQNGRKTRSKKTPHVGGPVERRNSPEIAALKSRLKFYGDMTVVSRGFRAFRVLENDEVMDPGEISGR